MSRNDRRAARRSLAQRLGTVNERNATSLPHAAVAGHASLVQDGTEIAVKIHSLRREVRFGEIASSTQAALPVPALRRRPKPSGIVL